MLRTETEAREKWCPFVRLTEDSPAAQVAWNRVSRADGPPGRRDCNCIASDCMQWQWFDREGDPSQDKDIDKRIDGKPTVPRHVPQEQRRGYCGLAGLPAQI